MKIFFMKFYFKTNLNERELILMLQREFERITLQLDKVGKKSINKTFTPLFDDPARKP